MKLKKRIAAVAAAMVMAVSTMAMSANAADVNKKETRNSTGIADTGFIRTSSGFGYAQSSAVNLTTTTRYMHASAEIYKSGVTNGTGYEAKSYKTENAAGNGGATLSGEARAGSAVSYRAYISGVLYNSQGTVAGGQYGSVSFNMYY